MKQALQFHFKMADQDPEKCHLRQISNFSVEKTSTSGTSISGGLSRIVPWPLGQRNAALRDYWCTKYPHTAFHTVEGGFLTLLPWRRGNACSAHLCYAALECPAPLHSWHICTNFFLPQFLLAPAALATFPCK